MKLDITSIWNLLRPYGRRYAFGAVALLACDAGQLGAPWILGRIIDGLRSGTESQAVLVWHVLCILGLALLVTLFRVGWRFYVFGTARMVERDLRQRLYDHLLDMAPGFFDRSTVGDLMAHATNDVSAVRGIAGEGVMAGLDSTIYIVSTLLLVFWQIDWRLSLLCLAPLPLIAVTNGLLGQRIHQRYLEVQGAFSQLSERVQESISGIRLIKGFVQEDPTEERFRTAAEAYRREFVLMERLHSAFDPVIGLLAGASMAIAVVYGGNLVLQGTMTLGKLATFLGLLGMLVWPMIAASWAYNVFARGTASLARLAKLFATPSDVEEPSEPAPLGNVAGAVSIRGLTFSYHPQATPVLRDIDVEIKPGQVLGLVGHTGSGKSTLVSLLLRLYDPPPGTVFLDGKDIRGLSLAELRRCFGYVPQDGFLFSRSVADNLDFSTDRLSMERAISALRLADVEKEMLELPFGLDTILGERGVTLSGGQRQRLGLARALLRAPRLLLLDDCLSAVDAATESRIIASLKQFLCGRTTIVVAHRLSIVRDCDLIVMLERGQIIERGTHTELLALDGAYARMWERQQLEAALAKEA